MATIFTPGFSFDACSQVEKNQGSSETKVLTEIGRSDSSQMNLQTKKIFIQCSFLGTAVTVGVTMFVLSISELSEVGMVRKEKYLTLLITLASCSVVKV